MFLKDPIVATVNVNYETGEGEEINLIYWDVGKWRETTIEGSESKLLKGVTANYLR